MKKGLARRSVDTSPLIYSKDFYDWPDRWMGFDEDLTTGKTILKGFLPFIKFLIEREFSKRTIKNHMNNLWLLGSEIIRGVHADENHQTLSPKALLLEYINEDGGPWVQQWDPNDSLDEGACNSYEATCRKLFQFLIMEK